MAEYLFQVGSCYHFERPQHQGRTHLAVLSVTWPILRWEGKIPSVVGPVCRTLLSNILMAYPTQALNAMEMGQIYSHWYFMTSGSMALALFRRVGQIGYSSFVLHFSSVSGDNLLALSQKFPLLFRLVLGRPWWVDEINEDVTWPICRQTPLGNLQSKINQFVILGSIENWKCLGLIVMTVI